MTRGIAYPFRIDQSGRVALSANTDHSIQESIQLILLTNPGERPLDPQFGAGLRTFFYQPNTSITRRLIRDMVEQALRRWETRITVNTVTVDPDPSDPTAAIVQVTYQVVGDGAAFTAAVPVALTGGE
ncbi:MAG TPA: GPW/gp25 family protein [Symbiobacteriaceae bacterium]|jgi:phage baseplate assembly protein W|nr:GPW/gp25 family protein [Symbiobacteriaceae bacterium]